VEFVCTVTNCGLNKPLTNIITESVILKGMIVDDILTFNVTVVGVNSCFAEILCN
jgi:hypothetical protein